ncbi:fad dependent oxidoreductase [Moniliophthora roreri MCA 2997]|uniref:Fad dependent oxidoreductase n=1 Tax=Moniliophthora roreri (strain MCA 2997) TaxID=1381753 RepID=V2XFG6_MONRO|nr:fad dependent oxidoreductase [Moniliophthora roreri MCA 2997]
MRKLVRKLRAGRMIECGIPNKEIQDDALRVFGEVLLRGEDEPVIGEGREFGWTGLLMSDSVPFTGAAPGKPGQWVIAGLNGHGMTRIFDCTPGLVKMMLREKWAETGMPECFEITEERFREMK